MATLQYTRITGSTAGTTNALEVVRPNAGSGPPGVFSFAGNDIAFRNKFGECYLNNGSTEAYFWSQNLPVTIYASAQASLFVTGPVTSGRVGVGSTPDGNGRLYVYGEGTTSAFLSINNCLAYKTASSSGYTLAGFVAVYIGAGVSGFSLAAGTYYFPIYSKP